MQCRLHFAGIAFSSVVDTLAASGYGPFCVVHKVLLGIHWYEACDYVMVYTSYTSTLQSACRD